MCIYNVPGWFEKVPPLFLLVEMSKSASNNAVGKASDNITQYGSTVYIGIAMVYSH